MLSVSGCSCCRAARRYFADHHVRFSEPDIEKDPAANIDASAAMASRSFRSGLHVSTGSPRIDANASTAADVKCKLDRSFLLRSFPVAAK